MKKGTLLIAAVAALAPIAIVAGSAQAATTYTPSLVYAFNTENDTSYGPTQLASFGDMVAVQLDNGELWVSDGTPAGTHSLEEALNDQDVTSFSIQRERNNPESLDIDGELYFFGTFDDGNNPAVEEIFKTDGTTVTRVTTGLGAWNAMYLFDGMIYAFDGSGAFQVDPSTGDFDEFYPEFDCTSFESTQVQMVGGKILFIGDNNSCDEQLFAWDPATPATAPVAFTASIGALGNDGVTDIDYMSDEQDTFTMFEGEMYFAARGNVAGSDIGTELFKTDGTQAGTVLVKDLNSGSESSSAPSDSFLYPTIVGDEMFFGEDRNGDMWKSDGTAAGTEQVMVGSPLGSVGDYTDGLAPVLNGKMITTFYDSDIGDALYSTDGTVAGTELLADTNSTGTDYSLCWGYCSATVLFDDHVFFIAYDGNSNNVWVTDGTPAGSVQVSTFQGEGAVGNTSSESLAKAGNKLFFGVTDVESEGGTGEMALYVIDATGGNESLATTGIDLNVTSLSSLVAMALVALAGAAVIARRRNTKA